MRLLGAGASGASKAANNGYCATGGGGGAYLEKVRQLTTGDVVTIVIGGGGTGVYNSDGSDGGASSIAISGFTTLIAGPGIKGVTSALTSSALGGLGGVPSGDYDIGYAGGRGGDSSAPIASGRSVTGGGGAGSYHGPGGRGGDISSLPTTPNCHLATGGGGALGNGGDVSSTTSGWGSGGGSPYGAALPINAAGGAAMGNWAGRATSPGAFSWNNTQYIALSMISQYAGFTSPYNTTTVCMFVTDDPLYPLLGGGSFGSNANYYHGADGGGSGACISMSGAASNMGGHGGTCGGSGGCTNNQSGYAAIGGAGGRGAGSGGVMSPLPGYSGKGGDGYAIIELMG